MESRASERHLELEPGLLGVDAVSELDPLEVEGAVVELDLAAVAPEIVVQGEADISYRPTRAGTFKPSLKNAFPGEPCEAYMGITMDIGVIIKNEGGIQSV